MMEIAFPPNTKRSGNVIIARKEEVELQKQNSEWEVHYAELSVWIIKNQFF